MNQSIVWYYMKKEAREIKQRKNVGKQHDINKCTNGNKNVNGAIFYHYFICGFVIPNDYN